MPRFAPTAWHAALTQAGERPAQIDVASPVVHLDHSTDRGYQTDIYFINASLAAIADPEERMSLMKIPTTLSLSDEQIGRLLGAASRLIRHDKEFQRLMQDIGTDK